MSYCNDRLERRGSAVKFRAQATDLVRLPSPVCACRPEPAEPARRKLGPPPALGSNGRIGVVPRVGPLLWSPPLGASEGGEQS